MIILIILICIPIYEYNAQAPFKYEFYEAIYGKMYLKDLFIAPDTNETRDEYDVIDDEEEKPESMLPDLDVLPKPNEHDLMDFNDISKPLINLTRRRSYDYFYGHDDPQDRWSPYWGWLEPKKKEMLMRINLQFLVHTRYKVYAALGQCDRFRTDKRYKLGYLFNRIRRLKYEMRKVISIASQQNVSAWFRSLQSLMRLYEKVVRFDIDIRDTSALIRDVYNEKIPGEHIETHSRHKPEISDMPGS